MPAHCPVANVRNNWCSCFYRKVGRPASYLEIQKRSFDMYSINRESTPEVTRFLRKREDELCPVIAERDGKV